MRSTYQEGERLSTDSGKVDETALRTQAAAGLTSGRLTARGSGGGLTEFLIREFREPTVEVDFAEPVRVSWVVGGIQDWKEISAVDADITTFHREIVVVPADVCPGKNVVEGGNGLGHCWCPGGGN
jgi:hypothetical protein